MATSVYPPESIGSVMSTLVPTCKRNDKLGEILHNMVSKRWDSITNVYVIDSESKLLGYIDMTSLIQTDHTIAAHDLMQPATVLLHPENDQEKAVFMAIKDDAISIPVADTDGKFVGAVTGRRIIEIMHAEHIEDVLLSSGLRRGGGIQMAKLATERTGMLVKVRAPWLLFGLVVGLGLGVVTSLFEASLRETVALAYFIPVVAYIADSVGTQTEAIAVRALAIVKINYWRYLLKELMVGFVLGLLVGILGGAGAIVISHSVKIGLVVSLSLAVASTLAAVLASAVPMIFKARGKDPALGSGPLSTALQDVISVVIYFVFAALIIR